MPRKPKKPCNHPGCPELSNEACCPKHRKKRRYLDQRGTAAERGYDYRWQKLRASKLATDPLCEECGRLAAMVHHIWPIREGGTIYKWDNLKSLCNSCHEKTKG